jgi:hypothetical protein
VKHALWLGLLLTGGLCALVPFLALLGLGVHRHADPMASTLAAMALVWMPALAVGFSASEERRVPFAGMSLIVWSLSLFTALPVYFPGERRDALLTGLAITGIGGDYAAANVPADPQLASPQLEVAEPIVAIDHAPAFPTDEDALVLPYEGMGRRMAVPVVFRQGGDEIELTMMFDTGATYTTLSTATLARLGIVAGPTNPQIELHTANGIRQSRLVLVDEVWLGNLRVPNVAIATCDACESDSASGLLGLNVSGAFNLQIDADRQEVVFHPRERFDRRIDIKPFTVLGASFTRYPGGRVEVAVDFENNSPNPIDEAKAVVSCDSGEWQVDLGPVLAGQTNTIDKRLPSHDDCASYQIDLHEAHW